MALTPAPLEHSFAQATESAWDVAMYPVSDLQPVDLFREPRFGPLFLESADSFLLSFA